MCLERWEEEYVPMSQDSRQNLASLPFYLGTMPLILGCCHQILGLRLEFSGFSLSDFDQSFQDGNHDERNVKQYFYMRLPGRCRASEWLRWGERVRHLDRGGT